MNEHAMYTVEVNHISALLIDDINRKIQVELISKLLISEDDQLLQHFGISPLNKLDPTPIEVVAKRYDQGIFL